MLRRLILAAPLLLALPAAAQEVRAGDITISQAWSRAAGAGGTGAGYLTITNHGAAPDRLVGASTPAARSAELHTNVKEGDVMRMHHIPGIEIRPGQTVTLEPGGMHVMLIGLNDPLKQGETVPVTLRFDHAGEVKVNLAVQAAGARGPEQGHSHNH